MDHANGHETSKPSNEETSSKKAVNKKFEKLVKDVVRDLVEKTIEVANNKQDAEVTPNHVSEAIEKLGWKKRRLA